MYRINVGCKEEGDLTVSLKRSSDRDCWAVPYGKSSIRYLKLDELECEIYASKYQQMILEMGIRQTWVPWEYLDTWVEWTVGVKVKD